VKPIASLSLDLDNEWSYLKTHGDPGWEGFPSYLPRVVPRFLDTLAERGLRITVFVVGQDAALERNAEPLARVAAAGHEIGNHSFRHEPWLDRYAEAEIDEELARTEDAVERVTGQRPRGFRGPGYSLSPAVLRALVRRGYRYDASTFPTLLGPLARAWYFATAKLTPQQREERRQLFGGLREGTRPLKPYRWDLGEVDLLEIPVTTLPVARVPMHLSYVLFLAGIRPALALAYFRAALGWCRALGVAPSILLHPLDFLSGDEIPSLRFFPGMGLPLERKLGCVQACLDLLARRFDVRSVGEHAELLLRGPELRRVRAR
jgi:hypothetical protein